MYTLHAGGDAGVPGVVGGMYHQERAPHQAPCAVQAGLCGAVEWVQWWIASRPFLSTEKVRESLVAQGRAVDGRCAMKGVLALDPQGGARLTWIDFWIPTAFAVPSRASYQLLCSPFLAAEWMKKKGGGGEEVLAGYCPAPVAAPVLAPAFRLLRVSSPLASPQVARPHDIFSSFISILQM